MPITKLSTASEAPVTAAPKDEDAYTWFTYTGKPLNAMNDKGRTLNIVKGEKFGVRKSGSGKAIRLVTKRMGPTKVFTCDPAMAQLLAKNCKPYKE